jgi:hypothetical protein
MAITLYDATVPSFLQILGAVSRLVDKAESFCSDNALAPEDLLLARLAEDMLPFAYQVKSSAGHSLGAIEGVRQGSFSPDMTPWPDSFDGCRERVAQAIAGLQVVDADEVESFIGRPMCFAMGSMRMDFTAEAFLLSFSQPNFYFHATTAYDVLRMKGVPLGKRDFVGAVRILA